MDNRFNHPSYFSKVPVIHKYRERHMKLFPELYKSNDTVIEELTEEFNNNSIIEFLSKGPTINNQELSPNTKKHNNLLKYIGLTKHYQNNC